MFCQATEMYCSSSFTVYGLWKYAWSFKYLQRKICMASNLVNREANPSFAYASCFKDIYTITEMFHDIIEHCRHLLWPSTILHTTQAILTVLQSILNGDKFVEDVLIVCWSNLLVSKERPNKPSGRNGNPKNDFWWM